jgi:hypothetical protein
MDALYGFKVFRKMKKLLKYIWKHFVKRDHEPQFMFDDIEGKCSCGARIYKNKHGGWNEV